MRVERYVADDMRQAMVKVRESLGRDALILSNRRVNGQTEIIAAIDSAPPRAVAKPAQLAQPGKSTESLKPKRKTRVAAKSGKTASKKAVQTESNPSLGEIKSELKRLRNMFEGELSQLSWREMGERQPNRLAVQSRLEGAGMNPVVSSMIADKVMPCKDLDMAWRNALKMSAHLVQIPDKSFMDKGGIIALVGPAGVGKTTTAAKIAAQFAARHSVNDVALISADDMRIGGKEQLLSYGSSMGIPVQFASTKEDLERTLASLSQKKLIIIDTAGMSARNIALADRLQTLQVKDRKIDTYLVLSATTQESILKESIRAFSKANLKSTILTRIDECNSMGPAISSLIRYQMSLTCLGNGPTVPENLIPADSKLLQENLLESYQKAEKISKAKSAAATQRRVVNG